MPLIDSTNSTPYFAAVEARTILSHMTGGCRIPPNVLPHRLTYWELIHYFSTFDRAKYPRFWRLKYIWLALWSGLSV